MTRPESAPGFTLWLTGLSGAGKTTVSRLASVDECVRRDPKGLYLRALAGELPDFTGVSAPSEEPAAPDLELDTELDAPQACADQVVALLESRGLVP